VARLFFEKTSLAKVRLLTAHTSPSKQVPSLLLGPLPSDLVCATITSITMLARVIGLLGTFAIPSCGQSLPEILSRVAEEAEVLQQNAPKVLTQETLEQRALLPPSRFRPAAGAAAAEPPKPRLQVREVVSEYSVGALKDSESHNLVEFRQVISVDGRTVQSAETARHALSLGVHSQDDRLRKRMLEDFARHGLVDVATDYGLILLAFSKRGLADMALAPAGEDTIGSEPAVVLAWQQKSSASGELEFHGRKVAHRALAGRLWVRKSDGLPLRVEAFVEHLESKHKIRDEGTVDYVLSTHGFLTPVSVVHRHVVDGQLWTENHYRYEPFKLFAADSDIKFTTADEAPPKK